MTQSGGHHDLSHEEVIQLLESWLRNSPELQFRHVRADAKRLNIRVTARQFSEAKRRVGVTSAPPRPVSRPTTTPAGTAISRSASVSAKTPLMNFVLDFLSQKPEATYADVKVAAEGAGFTIAPINFGNARRMLGMSAKPRTSVRPRPAPANVGPTGGETPPIARGRRGRRKGLDLSNLSSLVGELQDVVAERDRYLHALEQIAEILKKVL